MAGIIFVQCVCAVVHWFGPKKHDLWYFVALYVLLGVIFFLSKNIACIYNKLTDMRYVPE